MNDPSKRVVLVFKQLISVIRQTIASFNHAYAAQAAAGIAYYAFFSIFPLLLLLVVIGTFFMRSDQAIQSVIEVASQALPVSTPLLERNILRMVELRTSLGILSLVSLLWSATGVFTVLANNINLAWSSSPQPNFIQRRLAGFAMVGILALFYVAFLITNALVRSLPALLAFLEGTQAAEITALRQLLQGAAFLGGVFILFLGVYRFVPSASVRWKPAMVSAAVASIFWQIATNAFVWFLRLGFSRYELVYGALGTVVALLFLIYLNAWIVLFGAHLCAVLSGHQPLPEGDVRVKFG
jgi:membrane protein